MNTERRSTSKDGSGSRLEREAFQGKHSDITGKIISAFYRVHNQLGYGFSEKIYENALIYELTQLEMRVEQQKPIRVYYENRLIGEYIADLVVDDLVIVELKATRSLSDEQSAQLLNYLKATRIEVGLLLNFGPKAQFVRKIFDNERKGTMAWMEVESDSV